MQKLLPFFLLLLALPLIAQTSPGPDVAISHEFYEFNGLLNDAVTLTNNGSAPVSDFPIQYAMTPWNGRPVSSILAPTVAPGASTSVYVPSMSGLQYYSSATAVLPD